MNSGDQAGISRRQAGPATALIPAELGSQARQHRFRRQRRARQRDLRPRAARRISEAVFPQCRAAAEKRGRIPVNQKHARAEPDQAGRKKRCSSARCRRKAGPSRCPRPFAKRGGALLRAACDASPYMQCRCGYWQRGPPESRACTEKRPNARSLKKGAFPATIAYYMHVARHGRVVRQSLFAGEVISF